MRLFMRPQHQKTLGRFLTIPGVALGQLICTSLSPTCNRLVQYTASCAEHADVGAVKDLVKLVQRGSESASAAGAAHALAVFTTGKNASTYRASLQAAGGVPALLM